MCKSNKNMVRVLLNEEWGEQVKVSYKLTGSLEEWRAKQKPFASEVAEYVMQGVINQVSDVLDSDNAGMLINGYTGLVGNWVPGIYELVDVEIEDVNNIREMSTDNEKEKLDSEINSLQNRLTQLKSKRDKLKEVE